MRFARYLGMVTLMLALAGCLGESDDDSSVSGPQVSFTNPAGADEIQTPDVVVSLVGTASSDAKIESVGWANDRGGRGSASGKENWVTGNIVLQLGTNNITVTATDSDGDANSKSIAVIRESATGVPSGDSDDPAVLYSYTSDFSAAAPLKGASIEPGRISFMFAPSDEIEARGIRHVEYRCCKGLEGPGEGTPFGPSFNVTNKPWALGLDLTGMEAGGKRRMRTIVHFTDGSDAESITFDFTIAGGEEINRPPTISGRPTGTATAGLAYSFRPTATDADGDTLSFSISNKPSWANFSRSTGRLSGTPTANDLGMHNNITISVSDGKETARLSPFAISVESTGSGTATLTWSPPTERTDGTSLGSGLAGYEIHFGQDSNSYSNRIKLNNPGLASYVVDNLSSGTWYFSVSAFDTSGQKSGMSNEGQIAIP
jgi:hypothetical protein